MSRGLTKTGVAWLAVLGGTLGLHRFALHGARDAIGWLHAAAALVGAAGWWRLQREGVDDVAGGVLVLFLGASVVAAMAAALRHALVSDATWDARWSADARPPKAPSGGLAVGAAIVAAFVGATAAIAMLAFAIQRALELSLAR